MSMPGNLLRLSAISVLVSVGISGSGDLTAQAVAPQLTLAQMPLYLGNSDVPLMMMVMSRDEQLFNKAYTDYSDLDGDGVLDTTYQDKFDYAGYFDSGLCYTYDTAAGQFAVAAKAVSSGDAGNAKLHACSGQWSGNFLNWATMSRLDVVRGALYGGRRSVDDAGRTVLERSDIPGDVHSWAKVYGKSDISKFTPYSQKLSLCNTTLTSVSGEAGPPLMRVYADSAATYPEWAATEKFQCETRARRAGNMDLPPDVTVDLTVRVNVCAGAAGLRESWCRPYGAGDSVSYKPAGLLQKFGEENTLRFGLITGSRGKPRAGGVLRKNIGRFVGNGTTACAAGDEVNASTGQFCYTQTGGTPVAEGIIATLDALRMPGWFYRNAINESDSTWRDCDWWGIVSRQNGPLSLDGMRRNLVDPGSASPGSGQYAYKCAAWGNPVAEMYAEALRYITGGTANPVYASTNSDLPGMPAPAWRDPYDKTKGGSSYCAECSVLVISSGMPSFDSDQIGTLSLAGAPSAEAATDAIGGPSGEGIAGKRWIIGRHGATPAGEAIDTFSDECTAKAVTSFSLVRGPCPDLPNQEGSYLLAGLAWSAYTNDLRPALQNKQADADADGKVHVNNVKTYAIALAENLPRFDVKLGAGAVNLAPLCKTNRNNDDNVNVLSTDDATSRAALARWRSCSLASVGIGAKHSSVTNNNARIGTVGKKMSYGFDNPLNDGTYGSFSIVWEDSQFGSDHDNDVVTMMSYCVGSACNQASPNKSGVQAICWNTDAASPVCASEGTVAVGAGEALIRIENLSAQAGNPMLTGVGFSGSDMDGTYLRVMRPGGANGSLLTNFTEHSQWTRAIVYRVKLGSGQSGGILQNPLWYAAKYGNFTRSPAGEKFPKDAAAWSKDGKGVDPTGYFLARDPAKLAEALETVFRSAASVQTVGSGGSGVRLNSDSISVDSSYHVPQDSNDWTGDVKAFQRNADGSLSTKPIWAAAEKMPSAASRRIVTASAPTVYKADASGDVQTAVIAETFDSATMTDEKMGFAAGTKPAWMGSMTVSALVNYLRGEKSNERPLGTDGFRQRSSVLGDIINSNLELVTADYSFGWSWPNTDTASWQYKLTTGYQQFLKARRTAKSATAYVNANDGMLHAFDAGTGGGAERFAYVPNAVRRQLPELARRDYSHRYFMDGQITVGDVPGIGGRGANTWGTALLTAAGAGAPSISALDVSAPDSFTRSNVLWEMQGGAGGIADLGYVIGKPRLVPVAGAAGAAPRWVALFGNGVNSTLGRPVLFAVDVASGKILGKLVASASNARANGLINLIAISQNNRDGLVDTVYGGDLQGNVWKFDLSNADPGRWGVAYEGKPLFVAKDAAGNPQPITGGFQATRSAGGVALYFGTGRYVASGDGRPGADGQAIQVQSLYSVVDTGTPITASRESALQAQTMSAGASSSPQARVVGGASPKEARGWYVDLALSGSNGTGEMFIGNPMVDSGRIVFTTYEPTRSGCGALGVNWLYGLDLSSGVGAMKGLSLTRGGESICGENCGAVSGSQGAPVRDVQVHLLAGERGGTPLANVCAPDDPNCDKLSSVTPLTQCSVMYSSAATGNLYLRRACGRQSWRQLR